MAGQCKDCRFYDGKNCAVLKSARTSNSTCARWVGNTGPSTVKKWLANQNAGTYTAFSGNREYTVTLESSDTLIYQDNNSSPL